MASLPPGPPSAVNRRRAIRRDTDDLVIHYQGAAAIPVHDAVVTLVIPGADVQRGNIDFALVVEPFGTYFVTAELQVDGLQAWIIQATLMVVVVMPPPERYPYRAPVVLRADLHQNARRGIQEHLLPRQTERRICRRCRCTVDGSQYQSHRGSRHRPRCSRAYQRRQSRAWWISTVETMSGREHAIGADQTGRAESAIAVADKGRPWTVIRGRVITTRDPGRGGRFLSGGRRRICGRKVPRTIRITDVDRIIGAAGGRSTASRHGDRPRRFPFAADSERVAFPRPRSTQ